MALSKKVLESYEMVIGLEVHVELNTKSKLLCGCSTKFGCPPNSNVCPGCMGFPGALPVMNEKVIDYAIKAGIATNCDIADFTVQDRKNYFYPDLPQAYQVSQNDKPICKGGWLDIEAQGGKKRIGITRIHMEADAGKLIHVGDETLIDGNRSSVPLIEIVSEPDLRSPEEVSAYLGKLRAIIRYIGVSDCKMNEGAFRCDLNLSVRKKGTKPFGVRAEMKNINSFVFAVKAAEYEFVRQIEEIEAGGTLVQETRRFDANTGKTSSMRIKENATDYRYCPDPDLPPITISAEKKEALAKEIPMLPDVRKEKYVGTYGLSAYAAEQLTLERDVADYFEKCVPHTKFPVGLANIILNEVVTKIEDMDNIVIAVLPKHVAAVANLAGEDQINSATTRKVVAMLFENDEDPFEIVKRENMLQISDKSILLPLAKEVITEQKESVASYLDGKDVALQALVGHMMRKTAGKGNPQVIKSVLKEMLAR